MILAIGGMHRSGTSLLTKMLHFSGMALGDEERLMPAAEDNPEGFWEHLDFVDLNDRLLAYFGLAWDYLPDLAPDWVHEPGLDPFKKEARALIDSFADHPFWGWKDPRNTITFDFWKSLLPESKFILTIRHPLEVAQSLHERNFFSLINGLNLWAKYNERWRNRLNDPDVLVVHYDALLTRPEAELKRLFAWMELDTEKDWATIVEQALNCDLKHNNMQEVPESLKEPFTQVFDYYHLLCEKAGFVPEKASPSILSSKTEGKTGSESTPSASSENKTSDDKNGGSPLVSIIIPVFNKLEFTHRCLKSILLNTRYLNYEIVFVDNGSTDETRPYLQKLKHAHIKTVFNSQNLGYVGGCNAGAARAQGDYLLFLNNDTEVQPNWLTNMVALAQTHADAGVVGAKLVYPDGKLQEAGGIIFSDGNGWNYGRGFNPNDPRFNFVRKVDYVSGAALMIRRDLWEKIGGFDERYAPAYYEDTDLCFSARLEGFQVYYQPASVVIHHEGQTAGTDLASGFKKYQGINHKKFVKKWQKELKAQWENKPENVPFASERDIKMRLLVVDPFLPMWDRSSGSLRLFNYLNLLKQMNAHITFIARLGSTDPKYKQRLQQLGIEVYENDEKALHAAGLVARKIFSPIPYETLFKERAFDYAIISFWYLAEYFMDVIRNHSPKTTVIVDSVDIHFVRELREARLKHDRTLEKKALARKQRELTVYRKADRVWVVTEQDKAQIAGKIGHVPIDVLPNIHQPVKEQKQFQETEHLLFVGNFAHPPNTDAVRFLVQNIFPKIKAQLPQVKLYIVGNNPTPEIQGLQNDDIIVTGYVPDLKPYLLKARVSVSPLRYGAGMKGKIGEALSYGLPVVTTSVGAEGMDLVHETHALIADEPTAFAQAVVRLYKDRTLWEKLSQQGRRFVEEQWGPQASKQRLQEIFTRKQWRGFARWPEVSIVMLTFNALEYTKKCVHTILEHTQIPYEIIFVDNGSKDGTVQYLKDLAARYPHIKTIFNKHNKGFAYGNNQGARKARGQYLLFLNNDVLVSEGWLKDLLKAIRLNPWIGMVGPITNSISGLQRVNEVPYQDEAGFHAFAAQVREVNRNKITPRRRIAGFCMLMPKHLFEKLKGFDKQFGTGNFEDDDLCLRLRQHKYAIMVHEGVFIHHYGSQTFKANHIAYDHSIKSKARIFFKKWPQVDYEELLELKNPLSETHARLKEKIRQELKPQNTQAVQQLAKTILVENPLDTEARFYLALTLFWNNELVLALEQLKIIDSYAPDQPAVWNLMGQIFQADKNLSDAERAFKRAMSLDAGFLDARRNYAALLIEKGDFAAGIDMLNKIIEAHPDDVPALLMMANLFLEAERPQKALLFAQRVLQVDAQNDLARQMIDLIQKAAGPSQEKNAGNSASNSTAESMKEGLQALQKGDAQQALAYFNEDLKKNPQDLEALYGSALALEMQERFEEAKKVLEKVLEIDLNFTPAWNDLARICYQLKRPDKAADLFRKSLDIDENQVVVRNQLSDILLELGQFEQGLALLNETYRKFPNDLATVVHLAEVLQQANRTEEARRLWMQAMEIDPQNATAQEALKAMMLTEKQV